MPGASVITRTVHMTTRNGTSTVTAPTIPRTQKTPVKKAPPIKRARKPVAKPAFQEPLPATEPAPPSSPEKSTPEAAAKPTFSDTIPAPLRANPAPATKPERPKQHNGIDVVREELLSNLPENRRAWFKYSRLHLVDGTHAFACRDCAYTGDSRGDVMVHRNTVHGARIGRKPANPQLAPLKGVPDIVIATREDGSAAPSNPAHWTIAELLTVMPDIAATGDLIDRLENENTELRKELNQYRGRGRTDQHKIDVYETLQEELVTARMELSRRADYDYVKDELVKLRHWRKAIVKRLSGVGFLMTEED